MYIFRHCSKTYTHLTVRMDNPSPNDVDLGTRITTKSDGGSLG